MTSNRKGEGRAVWLSAVTGEGIPLLLQTVADVCAAKRFKGTIRLLPEQGRERALLFDIGRRHPAKLPAKTAAGS